MIEFFQKVGFEIIMIVSGIGFVIYLSRKPKQNHPLTSVKFKGYAAGIGFILIGAISILNKFKLW